MLTSPLLSAEPRIMHGFSTRAGGVSVLPHTASMNVADGHGDPPGTVRENIGILARAVSGGTLDERAVVCAPQIHSAKIRRVTAADAGSGVVSPPGESGDGFVTDTPGVLLMIRMADCVPILFSARREDGAPLAAAVHAGWRGTVAGIAPAAVALLLAMGAQRESIRCALGQAIHACCYEVGADFRDAVRAAQGADFAQAHIASRNGRLFADVPGMNRTLLLAAGLTKAQIELSPYCTACAPNIFHSHRASRGMRGAMGALIGIRAADGGDGENGEKRGLFVKRPGEKLCGK